MDRSLKEATIARYAALPEVEKARSVLAIMREATLMARGSYASGSDVRRLAQINELQHRLIGLASGLLAGSSQWSDDEAAQYLTMSLSEMGSPRTLDSFLIRGATGFPQTGPQPPTS